MTTNERILAIRQATEKVLTKQQVRDLVVSIFEETLKELHGAQKGEPEARSKLVPVYKTPDLMRRDVKGVRAILKEFVHQTIWKDMGVRFMELDGKLWHHLVQKTLTDCFKIDNPRYLSDVFLEIDKKMRQLLKAKFYATCNGYRKKIARIIGEYVSVPHDILLLLHLTPPVEADNKVAFDEKNIPNPTKILEDLETDPRQATPEQKAGLVLLYTKALASVNKEIEGTQVREGGHTPVRSWGDRWAFDMALAIVLLTQCSDTINIRANLEIQKKSSEERKKCKTSRLHIQTRAGTMFNARLYFGMVSKLRAMKADPRKFENLEAWERKILHSSIGDAKQTRKQTIPTDKLDDNQQLEEIDTSAAQKEEDEIFQQMWANHRKVLTGELSAEDAVDPFKDLPSWKDGDDKENQDPNGMPPLEGTVMYL